MPAKLKTAEDLIALFETAASAPPPEPSRMLARHLQCKESLDLARNLTEAMDRHIGLESQPLAPPTDLLPPLA